jgi:transposase
LVVPRQSLGLQPVRAERPARAAPGSRGSWTSSRKWTPRNQFYNWMIPEVPVPRQKRTFSDEFKAQAVALVMEKKKKRTEVARDLDIGINLLDAWIQKAKSAEKTVEKPAKASKDSPEAARIRELEKELERVKMERDILKKATAYFAKEST